LHTAFRGIKWSFLFSLPLYPFKYTNREMERIILHK
jgi:hypothetical protein